MTLDEALLGKDIPHEIRETLTLVAVPYVSFEGEASEGHLVVHQDLVSDVREIFDALFQMQFPIQQMMPAVSYDWDDDASMAANNSSAFNYRFIFGTDRLSNHSHGRAIDINPFQNPYTQRDGKVVPPGARYDPAQRGTVTADIADIFKSYGWAWGGDWIERKDWQHFEKPL